MEKMTRKKVLRGAKSSRCHPFPSMGSALDVTSPALKDVATVRLPPQWKEYGQRSVGLSKRSLLVDIGMSDIQIDDVISTVDLLDKFREGSDTRRATYSLSG